MNSRSIHFKDFDGWNIRKKIIHATDTSPSYFRERQIWWYQLGANIGYEQDGTGLWFKRPVLVIKKFNESAFLGIPLSTTKKSDKYHLQFFFGDDNRQNAAIISQIRFIDSKRLDTKMGTCNNGDFAKIRKAIRDMIP